MGYGIGLTKHQNASGEPLTPSPEVDPIEEKILHLLGIYPKISPSMMQIAIGSSMPAQVWKEVWDRLRNAGVVKVEHLVSLTPRGRSQTFTIYSLTNPPSPTSIVKS